MTRPMPGPSEHDPAAFPHVDPRRTDAECALCISEVDPAPWALSKRLTDAEAAAEYWRALRDDEWEDYDMLDGYGPPNIDPWGKEWWVRDGLANEARFATWHRLATLPHALEVTP